MLRKASCLREGNSYLLKEAVALTGTLPSSPQAVTFRTAGKLPVLPIDGKLVAAQEMFKKVLEVKEKNLGVDNLDTLDTVNDLANVSVHRGNYTEAFDLYRRVADGRLKKLGEKSPGTLEAFNDLAVVWSVLRKLSIKSDDANICTLFSDSSYEKKVDLKSLYVYLYSCRKVYLGSDHPDTLKTVMGYADLLHDMQLHETAKGCYEVVLKAWETTYGASSPEVLTVVDKLANVLVDLKQYDEAKEMYKRALDGRVQVFGELHIVTLSTKNNFANLLLHQGDFNAAKLMYESSLEWYKIQYGINHPETLKVVNNLAAWNSRYAEEKANYNKHHSFREAKKEYSRAVEGFEQALGPEHKYYLTALSNQAILIFQEVKMLEESHTAAWPVIAVNQTEEEGKDPCNVFFEVVAYP